MAFIYINGYPGIGKLTVARELQNLISKSQLLDNHTLIDPVARRYERSHPEYQARRKQARTEAFKTILASAEEATYIFTDQQSSDPIGSATTQEYVDAAKRRGVPFFSIILTCGFEENLKRLQAAKRGGGSNTKLTDVGILRSIRETEDINHLGGAMELEVDVSEVPATTVAKTILAFVDSHARNLVA